MNNIYCQSNLILPGDEEYTETLGNISLYWKMNQSTIDKENGLGCWVYGLDGLPRWVNQKHLAEYLGGGEYDLREEQLQEQEELEPFVIEEILEPII